MLERLLDDVLAAGAANVAAATSDAAATEALLAMQGEIGRLMADQFCLSLQGRPDEDKIAHAERALAALDASTLDALGGKGLPEEFVEMAMLRAKEGFLRRIVTHATAPLGGTA